MGCKFAASIVITAKNIHLIQIVVNIGNVYNALSHCFYFIFSINRNVAKPTIGGLWSVPDIARRVGMD
jgi:hypothetical protein